MIYLDLLELNAGEGSRTLIYIHTYLNLPFFFLKVFENYPTFGLMQGLKMWLTIGTYEQEVNKLPSFQQECSAPFGPLRTDSPAIWFQR